MKFSVIDKTTGKQADEAQIALDEDWAKHLCYCDMEGFAIQEDGALILMDECGQLAYCPEGRFLIDVEEHETAKDTMMVSRTCDMCRFDCSTPSSYENQSDWGCAREDEFGVLCDLLDLDPVDWGTTEPCPLWESIPVSLCKEHGVFPADEFCVKCLHPETEDGASGG